MINCSQKSQIKRSLKKQGKIFVSSKETNDTLKQYIATLQKNNNLAVNWFPAKNIILAGNKYPTVNADEKIRHTRRKNIKKMKLTAINT